MTQLIAISGKAGSGKDTVASYISTKYLNTYTEAFADPIKRACAEAFGIDINDFNDPILKEATDLVWNVSPRKIAQFVGTEMFRQTLHSLLQEIDNDFWVQRMDHLINGNILTHLGASYDDEDTIIISDLRFQNECDWLVENNAVIIHLTSNRAPDTVGIPGHVSEAGFVVPANYPNNHFITNNDTKEILYDQVDNVLRHSGLKLFYNKPTQLI